VLYTKAMPCVSVQKIQHEGTCQEAIQHKAKPGSRDTHKSAVFSVHTSKGGALSDLLYFLIVLYGTIFSSTQTAMIFSDQAISKCWYIQFLVVETIFRISLAVVLAI